MERQTTTSAVLVALATLYAMPTLAKSPPTRPDDGLLEEITVTHNYTLGRPGQPRFTPDGKTLLFLRATASDPRADLWAKDVETGQERRLLSAEALLGGQTEALSVEEKALRERLRVKTQGFTGFEVDSGGRGVFVKLSGKVWRHDLATGETAPLPLPEGAVLDPRPSPDGKRLAFVQGHDLHVLQIGKGKVRALTSGGTDAAPHGLAEFVAAEEMARYEGFWWAPDGERLAYQATDTRALEQFTIADAAHPESAAHVFPYPRPGRANATVRLFVVGVDGRHRTEIRWDRARYPYLARVTWPKKGPLSLLVQARDQRSQVFLRADPDSGLTAPLVEEHDEAWLNLTRTTPRWLSDGSYLWATESSGQWTLERHVPRKKSKKGGVEEVTVVLDGAAGFRSLAHVDEARGLVWFLGGPDPVEQHLYRAPLSGGAAPTRVTPEPGEHEATFSANGERFALSRATFEAGARTTLHEVAKLEERVSPLTEETLASEVASFASKGRPLNLERVPPEKAGGFHAAIVRPRSFEAGRRYPVVLYVYGGPHHNVVVADASRYALQQWMADFGFVVVMLDGRGTQWRGRAWERAIRERFGDVPLDDQVKGLMALGASYPELDLERVGVYGWSFGGYMSALAALRRPDVFKVAVAGAPVVDWRYYDTHYTERYLGLLDDPASAYDAASLLTYAPQLDRPLLLVHGVADDNVYFAHTLQLADALFRARRPFQLLPLVGLTHQVADPTVRGALYDRIVGFLGEVLW
jgi:dipeptidyl-peptidase-4